MTSASSNDASATSSERRCARSTGKKGNLAERMGLGACERRGLVRRVINRVPWGGKKGELLIPVSPVVSSDMLKDEN